MSLAFQSLRVREMRGACARFAHLLFHTSVVVRPVLILLQEECVMCVL